MTADDQVFGEAAAAVERHVGLRDTIAALLHRGGIDHLIGYAAILDLAIRRFDESIFVDARKRRERVDEADVGAFRRLDRADTAIMRRMHVAHFESGTLSGQAARAKR